MKARELLKRLQEIASGKDDDWDAEIMLYRDGYCTTCGDHHWEKLHGLKFDVRPSGSVYLSPEHGLSISRSKIQ